jgi:hypothetical protein
MAGIFLTALAIRLAMLQAGWAGAPVYTLTFTRMDALVLGGLLATIARSERGAA